MEDAEIVEFQHLYKKHFGKDITREEALSKYIRLLRTVVLTYKPMTEDEFKNLQARRI